jgi:[acyl-carrier-protein] S-malonyltransferase
LRSPASAGSGPEDELTYTRNAQPALLTHSAAVWSVVRGVNADVVCAGGHSLGEFSAYHAAGALSFEDAVRTVRLRGELMYDAGQARPGAMAAVLGLDDAWWKTSAARPARRGAWWSQPTSTPPDRW